MENYRKHLEIIQGVINRMASNSFSLKGWAVTLVVGIFTLFEKNTERMYFLTVYIPILMFWGLDSYYLLQEKLYRELYDKVRQLSEENIDFSMKLSIEYPASKKIRFCCCLFSVTELCFYIPLVLVSTGIILVII